jgi:predicted phosphoadenosine phosphosulfate sulfurtransferase
MKIYLKENVYDAALSRIRFLFDEFENVVVSFSGGKDSTVILNLALIVAEEKGRLPLKVAFLDQEAEWQNVIDYIRTVMTDKRVEPWWFQIPIRMTNSTSNEQHYLECWKDGGDWMREREPFALTENVYNTDRFHKMFPAIQKYHWADKPLCVLAGIRAEESTGRLAGLTSDATYKWVTWGKTVHKDLKHYNFYPIYDWSYTDVWKSIHDNKWSYSKVYDYFYQYGIPPIKMRVSNLHHETAVHQLFYLQEIERDTWNKLTKRLSGINQARHMTQADMFKAGKLPYMFNNWREYRDHLLENLVTDDKYKKKFIHKFKAMDEKYSVMKKIETMYKIQIATILAMDIDLTKIINWEQKPEAITYRRWKRGDMEFVNKSKTKKWIPVNV